MTIYPGYVFSCKKLTWYKLGVLTIAMLEGKAKSNRFVLIDRSWGDSTSNMVYLVWAVHRCNWNPAARCIDRVLKTLIKRCSVCTLGLAIPGDLLRSGQMERCLVLRFIATSGSLSSMAVYSLKQFEVGWLVEHGTLREMPNDLPDIMS